MIVFLIVVNILLLLCNIFFIVVAILNKRGIRIPDIKLKKHTISLSGEVENDDYKTTIAKAKNEIAKVRENQKKLVPQIQEGFDKLFKANKKLSLRVDALENQSVKKEHKESYVPEVHAVELMIDVSTMIDDKKIYLKNFRDGILTECKESEAQFCSNHITDSKISFYFCGDVATAIATKEATFDAVCELIGWQSNVRSLSMVKDGTARKYSEGKWKVEQLAQIKCE